MNKIAAYEAALSRIETEKLAEFVQEVHGVSGRMPAGYTEAFVQMYKEANAAAAAGGVASFIPKLRSWMQGAGSTVKNWGSQMRAAGTAGLAAEAPGIVPELQSIGGRALQRAGSFVSSRPLTSAALGTAGVGYGGYRMLRGGGQQPNYPVQM
jgi:hypothetical protein